jgi:hypothetical protein
MAHKYEYIIHTHKNKQSEQNTKQRNKMLYISLTNCIPFNITFARFEVSTAVYSKFRLRGTCRCITALVFPDLQKESSASLSWARVSRS